MNLNKTRKWLKENNIRAVPGDKSNGFTLMKKQDYDSRVLDILKLKQFKKIHKQRKNAVHPVLKTQETINDFLSSLEKQGKIPKKLCDELKSR